MTLVGAVRFRDAHTYRPNFFVVADSRTVDAVTKELDGDNESKVYPHSRYVPNHHVLSGWAGLVNIKHGTRKRIATVNHELNKLMGICATSVRDFAQNVASSMQALRYRPTHPVIQSWDPSSYAQCLVAGMPKNGDERHPSLFTVSYGQEPVLVSAPAAFIGSGREKATRKFDERTGAYLKSSPLDESLTEERPGKILCDLLLAADEAVATVHSVGGPLQLYYVDKRPIQVPSLTVRVALAIAFMVEENDPLLLTPEEGHSILERALGNKPVKALKAELLSGRKERDEFLAYHPRLASFEAAFW